MSSAQTAMGFRFFKLFRNATIMILSNPSTLVNDDDEISIICNLALPTASLVMFFDGKSTGRTINLGGAPREDRTAYLARLEKERKERELARQKQRSAGLIQAVWRSHRARVKVKEEFRTKVFRIIMQTFNAIYEKNYTNILFSSAPVDSSISGTDSIKFRIMVDLSALEFASRLLVGFYPVSEHSVTDCASEDCILLSAGPG